MGGRDSRVSEPGALSWEGSAAAAAPPLVAPREAILRGMSFRGGGRGDVTAILQPKILKEINFAWYSERGGSASRSEISETRQRYTAQCSCVFN